MALSATASPVRRRPCCWTMWAPRAARSAQVRSPTCKTAQTLSSSRRRADTHGTPPGTTTCARTPTPRFRSGRRSEPCMLAWRPTRSARACGPGGRALRRLPGIPGTDRPRDPARHPRAAGRLSRPSGFASPAQRIEPSGGRGSARIAEPRAVRQQRRRLVARSRRTPRRSRPLLGGSAEDTPVGFVMIADEVDKSRLHTALPVEAAHRRALPAAGLRHRNARPDRRVLPWPTRSRGA